MKVWEVVMGDGFKFRIPCESSVEAVRAAVDILGGRVVNVGVAAEPPNISNSHPLFR